MPVLDATIQWLLDSAEPWTRYRTLVDLLDRPDHEPQVQAARAEMLAHPQVQALIAATATWGERPLKRHSDASHPIYAFSTLADFGARAADEQANTWIGLTASIEAVLAHQSADGAFQTLINLPTHFGGTGEDTWTWVLCDAPTLLYSLLVMGLAEDPRVQTAVTHLVSTVHDNGWHCTADSALGEFKGPGRKEDPCPIVNVYALKALAQIPDLLDSPTTRAGTEMLLQHWECQAGRKLFLFGIGTDFRKLKYPFVWYNILHVVEVLSHYPFVQSDPRFQAMVNVITRQADDQGRYTATSMYRAWKDWSFADKKNPSPWLTFLVLRLLKRMAISSPS